MSRREQILKMLEDEPNDVFLNYALAMEWDSEGDSKKSQAIYRRLMSGDPPHVDSFFRVAQQLSRDGEIEESRSVLRDGIRHAREQGESHTAAEMSEMLQDLGTL